jgi:type IV secretion system protein VirD4
LQIIFAPREQQDANDYSDMLGYTTVSKESISKGRDVSRSRSDERRALMLPQELKAMGPDKEVILYEGIAHPVKCEKIRYYEDKRFKARLLLRIDIPELVLKGDKQMGMKTNVIAAAGVAIAAMTQTAVAEPEAARIASAGPVPAAPYVNAAAKQAADRFLAFVVALNSTADLTKAKLEEAFQEEMLDGENGSVYISPLLSNGWIYAVERHPAKAKFKQAFEFGFYNGDRSADPSPVCVLDLASLCPALAKGGYTESVSRADIGGVVSINFAKNDVVLTIVARDIINSPDGRECVRAISSGR